MSSENNSTNVSRSVSRIPSSVSLRHSTTSLPRPSGLPLPPGHSFRASTGIPSTPQASTPTSPNGGVSFQIQDTCASTSNQLKRPPFLPPALLPSSSLPARSTQSVISNLPPAPSPTHPFSPNPASPRCVSASYDVDKSILGTWSQRMGMGADGTWGAGASLNNSASYKRTTSNSSVQVAVRLRPLRCVLGVTATQLLALRLVPDACTHTQKSGSSPGSTTWRDVTKPWPIHHPTLDVFCCAAKRSAQEGTMKLGSLTRISTLDTMGEMGSSSPSTSMTLFLDSRCVSPCHAACI